MVRKVNLLTVLVLALLASALQGCQAGTRLDPRQQVYLMETGLTGAMRTLTVARRAGQISDERWPQIDRGITEANTSVVNIKASVRDGDPISAAQWAELERLVYVVIGWSLEAEAGDST